MKIYGSRLFAESWNVAWRNRKEGGILADTETPFIVVENSWRYWAADPFVFEDHGRTYIFAELYDYIKRHGVIGCCEIVNGKTTPWKPIMVEDYHLSFPYIYRTDSSVYIMPEASGASSLYTYKAVEFPYKWVKDRCFRQGVKYADTVFISDSYALTFDITDRFNPVLKLIEIDHAPKDRELNLPHMELRRPAGRTINGNIRPAQNCIGDYGKGLIFYEFALEDDQYSEKEIKRIMPDDVKLSRKFYLDGMHTYNSSENYEVIDIKTRRLNLINLIMRLLSKI